jgi:2-iminobutanoate/2-iminopropanoate deaminase
VPLTHVSTDRAPAPGGSYSQAVVAGDLVHCAGQVGIDPATGVLADGLAAQVEQAIRNLEQVLVAAGSGLDLVTKVTCFLTDIGRFADFDEVYRRLVPQPFPARSTVGVALAGDLLFEIEAAAVRRTSG